MSRIGIGNEKYPSIPRQPRPGHIFRAALVLAALGAPVAQAHHAAAPHFDLEKIISLQATVTKFEFVNPHGYVYFNVEDGGKQTPWRCELPARAALARLGWTDNTFRAGQKIVIKGSPARREANVCMLTSFVREDGVEIRREADLTRMAPADPKAVSSAAASGPRPAKLPSGEPNLAGFWVSQSGSGGRGRGPGGPGGRGRGPGPDGRGPAGPGMGRGPGGPGGRGPGGRGPGGLPELTEAGLAVQAKYDQRFDDPGLKCSPANIFFGWTHDQHVNEIVQGPKEIVIKYGYMDLVRTIHMNAAHPKTVTPNLAGHSVGKWEGDTLVVDTVGFTAGVLMPMSGHPFSAGMHAVERFTVNAETGVLTRTYTADDATYWKNGYSGSDTMALSKEPFVPYACKELSGRNNQRPQ